MSQLHASVLPEDPSPFFFGTNHIISLMSYGGAKSYLRDGHGNVLQQSSERLKRVFIANCLSSDD